jgi:DNA-binding CsgD family transcriptional regulator
MLVLSARDVATFSAALARLYAPASLAAFPAHVLAVIGTLIANCSAMIDDIEVTSQAFRAGRSVGVTAAAAPPKTVRHLQCPDSAQCVVIENQSTHADRVALALPHRGRHATAIVLRSRYLTAREITLLRLLAPHVAQAYANISAAPRTRTGPEVSRLAGRRFPNTATKLTPREMEVCHWLAQGKRNREIAVILGASPRTIQKHVQKILDKVGVETRCAAAAWWYGGIV